MADVTVRTLHHYDDLGLLAPSGRTAGGYRTYDIGDLERLQRILAYRELGLGLDEITKILDDPEYDIVAHLRRQHELLRRKRARLDRIITTLEKTMEAHELGITLTPEEMLEVFGDFDPTEHADEVEQRWGDSDAYRESHRRTSAYTKADWLAIQREAEEITEHLVEIYRSARPAESPEAMDAVEAHRQHISRWFYECSYEIQRGLGDMYVADPRFTKTYDDKAPGLAQYVRDAIHANADRAERS